VILAVGTPGFAQPVSFRNDVMAVLSKAGCNQGTCHESQNGKNGFKLSLRGEDPLWDLNALTRDGLGRRVEPSAPDGSLVLLKATGSIPHEGGRRFDRVSADYRLVRQWIEDGARDDMPHHPVLQRIEVEPRGQVLVAPPTGRHCWKLLREPLNAEHRSQLNAVGRDTRLPVNAIEEANAAGRIL
jgi:hypothetical protein